MQVEAVLFILLLAVLFGWGFIGRLVGCFLTVVFVIGVILLAVFYAYDLMQPPWQ